MNQNVRGLRALLTLEGGGAKFRFRRGDAGCSEDTLECASAKIHGRNECTRGITAVEQKSQGIDCGLFVGDSTNTNLSLSKLCGEKRTERESERVVHWESGAKG